MLQKLESSMSEATSPSTAPSAAKTPKVSSQSEWQLLAVLHRANLVQYFDTFISQGGDDINQIMQCDEAEFLEIMSLVGMLSKPLHVRRLQRTLTEFSKDQTGFNLAAMQQIGPPPGAAFPTASSSSALDFLLPGIAVSLGASLSQSHSPSSSSFFAPDSSTPGMPATPKVPTLQNPIPAIDFTNPLSVLNTNLLTGEYLQNLVATAAASSATSLARPAGEHNITTANSKEPMLKRGATLTSSSSTSTCSPLIVDDFVALGDVDPNSPSACTPTLSKAQIDRLHSCADNVVAKLPHLAPRLVQNKKRVSQEIIDLMSLPVNSPTRAEEYRKFSAIYARFDAKRKPDKVLTLHEVSVNEAAAQLCMLQPVLLTRRDELFPLVVRDAGYHYSKGREKRKKEDEERSTPSSSPAPSLGDSEDKEPPALAVSPEEKRQRLDPENWCALLAFGR